MFTYIFFILITQVSFGPLFELENGKKNVSDSQNQNSIPGKSDATLIQLSQAASYHHHQHTHTPQPENLPGAVSAPPVPWVCIDASAQTDPL